MTVKHPYGIFACVVTGITAVAIIATNAVSDTGTRALTEVSRKPFQQYVNNPCLLVYPCIANFSSVPARSRLDVSNVSCLIHSGFNGTVLRVAQLLLLDVSDTILSASTLAPTLTGSVATSRNAWSANHAVSVFASARQRFQAYAEIGGPLTVNDFLACHISGQMVKLG